jgi:hypothetical protein
MIDTNADIDRLILDGDRDTITAWFEANLPGDEIADFREALIDATVRLTGEDREFLASNGYKIVED